MSEQTATVPGGTVSSEAPVSVSSRDAAPITSAPAAPMPGHTVVDAAPVSAEPRLDASGNVGASHSAKLVELRAAAANAAPGAARDAAMDKYSAYAKYVHMGQPLPSALFPNSVESQARAADMRPITDSMGNDTLQEPVQPTMSDAERSQLETFGKIRGMSPEDAGFAARLATEMKMSHLEGKTLVGVIAHHVEIDTRMGVESFKALSPADQKIYHEEAARLVGSAEKLNRMADLSAAYLAHIGLWEKLEPLRATSLAYSPHFLGLLSARALALGLSVEPK